jgi:hypothetical protein
MPARVVYDLAQLLRGRFNKYHIVDVHWLPGESWSRVPYSIKRQRCVQVSQALSGTIIETRPANRSSANRMIPAMAYEYFSAAYLESLSGKSDLSTSATSERVMSAII